MSNTAKMRLYMIDLLGKTQHLSTRYSEYPRGQYHTSSEYRGRLKHPFNIYDFPLSLSIKRRTLLLLLCSTCGLACCCPSCGIIPSSNGEPEALSISVSVVLAFSLNSRRVCSMAVASDLRPVVEIECQL